MVHGRRYGTYTPNFHEQMVYAKALVASLFPLQHKAHYEGMVV
jgi:hypothetical protein